MSQLQWDVRVARSPEPEAQAIVRATHALDAGDRARADQGYRDLQRQGMAHPASWSNLAALGIALGDAGGARANAQRALQLDRDSVDAWVNLGVASWQLGQRRDAAMAMHRALALDPGLEAAALNYARMLQLVDRPGEARKTLELAVLANPGAWRLRQALAQQARLDGDAAAARQQALEALARLGPHLQPQVDAAPRPGAENEAAAAAASANVQRALFAAGDALDAAGVPFHLIGGTLLAIHRDGRPFPHDKDVDLALPYDSDRDAVAAAFAGEFRPVLRAEDPRSHAAREWVMGFTHQQSGIGVDLMFAREQDGMMRFELGWPDYLACEMPAYPLQPLHWGGRDWLAPAPPRQYLDAIYGPDWNATETSRGFDRRWFDTQVSNPSRTPESLPRAVTLVLLRLLQALQAGQWEKARALCIQVQAREPLPEVGAMLARLERVQAT